MNPVVLSNSSAASCNARLIRDSEPSEDGGSGVYIGKTLVYKRPFFLETGMLLSPHLIAIGMTGSGKTYFLKSYLIRNRLIADANILILDWNGEYDETIRFLDGDVITLDSKTCASAADLFKTIQPLLNGVCSISLARLQNDQQRRITANALVESIIETMHAMPIENRVKRIILLDEAWKMLGENRSLGQLFREGRKYGFSIVIATQLVKDVNNEMLANAGSAFIFRLQNEDDYSTLVDTGIATKEEGAGLSNLSIGNCLVHLAQKSGNDGTETFFIKRIDGFSIAIYTIIGESMQVKISSEHFQKVTERQLSVQVRAKLTNYIEANNRSVDLAGLARLLVRCGVSRQELIVYLRLLGLDDKCIMGAYEKIKDAIIEIQ